MASFARSLEFSLSTIEKEYIRQGIQYNMRQDGRSILERRSLEIATGTLTQAAGSSSVLLDSTAVLVGIHTKIGAPLAEHGNRGLLHLSIDCAPSGVSLERQYIDYYRTELECDLNRLLVLFDSRQLAIIPGQSCWILDLDVLVLHDGGNLLEAIYQGIRSALATLSLPKVLSAPSAMMRDSDEAESEADESGILLSDDPEEAWQLDMKSFPILKSILQVGKQFIVDPTREETLSCDSAFCISVNSEGCIGSVRKSGFGFIKRSDLTSLLSIALSNE